MNTSQSNAIGSYQGHDQDIMFNSIVEITPNIIVILQQEKFVFINTKGLKILNLASPEAVFGESVFNFVDPAIHPHIKRHFKHKIYNGSDNPLQLKMLTSDQKRIILEVTSTPFTYMGELAVLIVGQDVTLEVQQAEKIREAEQRYQEIFINSHENLFLLEVLGDSRFRMLELNPQFEKEMGINRKHIIGKLFDDYAPASIAKVVNEKCQQCVESREVFFEEVELELPDGPHYYNTRLVPIFNEKGEVCRINGIAWDITEHKQMKDLLTKKQRVLEDAQQIGKIGSWERNILTNQFERSEEVLRIYGLDPHLNNASPDLFLNRIHPEDRKRLLKISENSIRTNKPFMADYRLLFDDGQIKYIHEHCETFYDSHGNAIRSVGTVQDISTQKQIENLLNLHEQEFKTLVENSTDIVVRYDTNCNRIYFNPAFLEISGFSASDLMGESDLQHSIYTSDTAQAFHKMIEKVILTKQPQSANFQLMKPSGDLHHTIKAIPEFDLEGNLISVLTLARDITEHENSRQQLEMLSFALNNSSDGIFISESDSANFLFVNDSACMMLGYNREDLMKLTTFDINPDVKMEVVINIGDVLKKSRSVTFETRYITKGGLIFPVEITSYRYEYNDKSYIVTATKNITERKQAEKILKDEHNLFNAGPNVAFKWTAAEGWPVEHVSMNVRDQFGYTPEDFISGKVSYSDIIHPDDIDRVSNEVETHSQHKFGFFEQEYRIKTAFGDYRWIFDFTVPVLDSNGEITHYKGYINDITERRLTEDQLHESERRYSELFDNSNDKILLLEATQDHQFRVLAINAQYESEMDVLSSEFVGKTILENVGEKLGNMLNAKYQHCIDLGRVVEETIEVDSKGGKRYHHSTQIPIRNNLGEVYRLMVIDHDITHEMDAKQELEKNRNLLSSVEINAQVGHFFLDYDNQRFLCSEGVYNILGLPYNVDVIDDLNLFEYLHPEDAPMVKEKLEFALKTNTRFDHIHRIIRSDGEVRVLHCTGNFLLEPTGKESYFCNMHDITTLQSLKDKVLISEDKIKILVENSPIGILILSERKPLFVNNALLEMAGVDSLDGLLKINTADLVHVDDQRFYKDLDKLISEVKDEKSNYQFTVRSPEIYGRSKVSDVRVTSCIMEGKNYVQILIIDITNEIEKENLIAKMASDSLYINQKSSVVAKVKLELDTVLHHKCENCRNDESFKNILRTLDSYSSADADWGLFNKNFENLHPKFIDHLKRVCPSLSLTDVKHCACIRLHIDTKETARFFNVSPTSIQTSRVRLKKKLNLPKDVDLRDFIESI